MTILSTLVTGWLIGATAAAAAPLPGYFDLFPNPAQTAAQVERERAQEQAQKERERAQEQAQRERERKQELAQKERERAQAQAQAQREQTQRERERAQEQAQRERERAQEQAQTQRERAQEQAQRTRERAQDQAERERERAQRESRRGNNNFNQVDGEKIFKTFSVGRNSSLFLHNISGDIVVTAGGGSEIRVEALKHAKGRSGVDAKQQLENVVVVMREAGGRVEVITEHRGRDNRGWVDFNVILPADAGAELHSVSGDITVTGVKGELRAETVSGDVRGSGLARLALLKSLSGDVEVNNAEADMLTVSSVSGDVTVTNLRARGIDANSISGNTVLRQCTCDRVQAQSVSGNIEYNGRMSKGGRYELKSHSGDVMLYHLGSAFELAASTFSGDIKFDPAMPTTLKSVTNRYGPGRSLRGAVGGGGAYIEITTFSGDILVAKGQ